MKKSMKVLLSTLTPLTIATPIATVIAYKVESTKNEANNNVSFADKNVSDKESINALTAFYNYRDEVHHYRPTAGTATDTTSPTIRFGIDWMPQYEQDRLIKLMNVKDDSIVFKNKNDANKTIQLDIKKSDNIEIYKIKYWISATDDVDKFVNLALDFYSEPIDPAKPDTRKVKITAMDAAKNITVWILTVNYV